MTTDVNQALNKVFATDSGSEIDLEADIDPLALPSNWPTKLDDIPFEKIDQEAVEGLDFSSAEKKFFWSDVIYDTKLLRSQRHPKGHPLSDFDWRPFFLRKADQGDQIDNLRENLEELAGNERITLLANCPEGGGLYDPVLLGYADKDYPHALLGIVWPESGSNRQPVIVYDDPFASIDSNFSSHQDLLYAGTLIIALHYLTGYDRFVVSESRLHQLTIRLLSALTP